MMMQVAQWASIYPHLLHNRHELPAESTSWLSQALQTIRDQYSCYPQPLSAEVQVLLWQAREELGNLFEPDADADIFNAVITQRAKSRVSKQSRKLESFRDAHSVLHPNAAVFKLILHKAVLDNSSILRWIVGSGNVGTLLEWIMWHASQACHICLNLRRSCASRLLSKSAVA